MCKFHNSLLSNNYEIGSQNIIIKNRKLMIAESNIFRTLKERGGARFTNVTYQFRTDAFR